jgi:DUF1009 family protein
MTETAGALGLVAGSGDLPRLIAEDCALRGEAYVVVRFEAEAAPWADAHPGAVVPHEKPGRLLAVLREAGCDRVVFAGAMTRPQLRFRKFDLKAMMLAPRVLRLLRKRDDAMLRGFADILEKEGFRIVGAHERLGELLAPAGVLGRVRPSDADCADVAKAADAVRALGADDRGQAAVAAGGECLGEEDIEGTDALLRRVARHGAHSGVLYKAPKPRQDWRLDLPAIGPETVRNAAAAGLAGIAVEAGGVLVLGLEETVAEADRLGLFLLGRGT